MPLLTNIARSDVVARQLKDRLLGAFKGAGWRVDLESSRAEGRFRPDMVAHRGPRRYAVELKVAREPRRSLLQAMLADAILQARVHAQVNSPIRGFFSRNFFQPWPTSQA
jgi:hypothetical protein